MPEDPQPTSNVRLDPRPDDDCLHVHLAGDLDMAATFKVEPEVDRLLAENDVSRLVLDLGEVRFMDSAGLGALLSIRERTDGLGIALSLANPSDPVRRIIELSGTGDAFAD